MLAKDVLKTIKTLLIPPLIVDSCRLADERLITFDEVEIEKPIKIGSVKIIPDAILYKKYKDKEYKLIVEFKKTHAVDINKKEKIKKLNISCIEIDLKHIEALNNRNINISDMVFLLAYETLFKKWIYNSKSDELLSIAKTKSYWKDLYAKKEKEKLKEQILKHINNLEEQGYKFIKTFEYEKYYDDFSLERKANSETYIEEKIYCPKIIIKERKQKIDLVQCKECEYHLKTIYKEDSRNYVVCGFENNLIK